MNSGWAIVVDTWKKYQPELIIRITRKYRGIGINQPLVRMNMAPREHIGGSLEKRILGREMVIAKHAALFARYPQKLAYHYFQLGLWRRDSGDLKKARGYFFKAFRLSWSPRYFAHHVRTFLFR